MEQELPLNYSLAGEMPGNSLVFVIVLPLARQTSSETTGTYPGTYQRWFMKVLSETVSRLLPDLDVGRICPIGIKLAGNDAV